MDQYIAMIIIAVITGVFSLITVIIQKKQDKVINKIDEQTMFIEREKELKKKMTKKHTERDAVIHEIIIYTLDTNLSILKHNISGDNAMPIDEVLQKAGDLKKRYDELTKDIEELNKEYDVILNLSSDLQKKAGDKKK